MSLFSFFKMKKNTQTEHKDFIDSFSKEVLGDILNSSNCMMLIFSREEGWIGANKRFYEVFAYKDIEDFKRQHRSVRDMFISEGEEIFLEDDISWLKYLYSHKKEGYRVKVYDALGHLLDINLYTQKSVASNNIYILEFEDVSKLEFAKEQIHEVDKLKTKFLANIGHEFRTPMNGIIGFIELLSNTQLDKVQTEYLHLIQNSAKNLMSNIETLLDLSQMQGGRLVVENEDFEITSHMEELLYHHIIVAKEKGVKLICFIDPKLPQELNGDIRKIKQIVNSLVQNAIKFTPRSGTVIVEVKLLKRQLNGDCSIGFSVKDNGKGISKHKISEILEPFASGDQADERLGVGLSLANGLVKLLDSTLHIQSQENMGSLFNFVLKFRASKGQAYKMMPKKKVKVLLLDKTKVDEANSLSNYLRSFSVDVIKANVLDANIYDDIEALYIFADQNDSSWVLQLGTFVKKVPVVIYLQEGEKLKTKLNHVVDKVITTPLFPSRISKHLGEMHGVMLQLQEKQKLKIKEQVGVLVVEDNLINQKLMQIMLQEYKMDIYVASNGNEAIAMCQKNRFDLIFMDIDMPQKNGIAATQEIKLKAHLNRKTPIVALTALAMQGDKEMLLREGLDDYVAKPINREKLEGILNRYLEDFVV